MPSLNDVAILGAGTMGHALALVHAIGGCRVRLYDNSTRQLEQAPALIEAALDTIIDAGQFAPQDKATVLQRISPQTTLTATTSGAELIIEAVVEDREVKRQVYKELDDIAAENAIIASNTSYLDIFPLLPQRRLARALITHWYTPPYIIDLVDIAPGPETDPALIEMMRDLYAGFGKKPVVFKSMLAGYVANRLQAALALEIFHLVDEGLVSAQDVDDSIMHGLSLRMVTLGFFKKADFTGLEMMQRALANQTYSPPPVRPRSESLDRLVEQGRSGVMAGAGFYDYGGQSPVELFRQRDIKLLKLKAAWQALENREAD